MFELKSQLVSSTEKFITLHPYYTRQVREARAARRHRRVVAKAKRVRDNEASSVKTQLIRVKRISVGGETALCLGVFVEKLEACNPSGLV